MPIVRKDKKEPVKKVKLSRSVELSDLSKPSKPASVSPKPKVEKRGMALPNPSTFDEGYAVIQALPDPVKQENDQIIECIRMFNQLQTMARTLEDRFTSNPSSQTVYALMKIYDQVREIIADLRALRDVQQMGETLNREVISPYTRAVAAALTSVHQNLKADIKSVVPPEYIQPVMRLVDQHISTSATEVHNSYHNALVKTIEVFGG